jgi:hypothetical protein
MQAEKSIDFLLPWQGKLAAQLNLLKNQHQNSSPYQVYFHRLSTPSRQTLTKAKRTPQPKLFAQTVPSFSSAFM